MLATHHRLRTSSQFSAVLRGRGRGRAAGRLLVVHVASARQIADALPDESSEQVRVGFVVSKAVGNAVVRNRTKRRLRHLMQPMVSDLPAGSGVVIRALPAAAAADSQTLRVELTKLVDRAFANTRAPVVSR